MIEPGRFHHMKIQVSRPDGSHFHVVFMFTNCLHIKFWLEFNGVGFFLIVFIARINFPSFSAIDILHTYKKEIIRRGATGVGPVVSWSWWHMVQIKPFPHDRKFR